MTVAAHAAPAVRQPLVPNALLGTIIFVAAEVMIFCGLISAYVVLREQAGPWPPPNQPRLPVMATAFNTALLVLSGVTMWRCVTARMRSRHRQATRLLTITFILGVSFVVLQGLEWVSLLRFGLTARSSLYGGLFYTLVGCHAVHVTAALIVLGVYLRRATRAQHGPLSADGLRALRAYWMFVVAVWPPLYGLVYLW